MGARRGREKGRRGRGERRGGGRITLSKLPRATRGREARKEGRQERVEEKLSLYLGQPWEEGQGKGEGRRGRGKRWW